MHIPEGVPVDLVGACEVRRAQVFLVAEERVELFVDPGPRMHAVRDRDDRHLVRRALRPEVLPHLSRDLAVQRRDTVRVGRRAQRERRQPEAFVGRLHPAERQEFLPGVAAALDEERHVALDERGVEDLVPCRHRRVGREHRRCAQPLQCGGTRELHFLDELAQPFELQERRVALVHVEDGRIEPECAEHAHAADAEHELLPEPVLAVAAVELVGDRSRPVGVAVDVSVEQVERHTPDLRAPDLCAHGREVARVVGKVDDHAHLLE